MTNNNLLFLLLNDNYNINIKVVPIKRKAV